MIPTFQFDDRERYQTVFECPFCDWKGSFTDGEVIADGTSLKSCCPRCPLSESVTVGVIEFPDIESDYPSVFATGPIADSVGFGPVETGTVLEHIGFRRNSHSETDLNAFTLETCGIKARARRDQLFLMIGELPYLDSDTLESIKASDSGDMLVVVGNHSGPRSLGYFGFCLKPAFDSLEQGVAWFLYCLKRATGLSMKKLVAALGSDWAYEALENQHLLPRERRKIKSDWQSTIHAARPCCCVDREWFRPARKMIRELPEGDDPVTVRFDGQTLFMNGPNLTIAMPAQGSKTFSCSLPIASLQTAVPPRFKGPSVTVSTWEGCLVIDDVSTKAVIEPQPRR